MSSNPLQAPRCSTWTSKLSRAVYSETRPLWASPSCAHRATGRRRRALAATAACADPSAHLLWDQVLFCASHVGYRDVGTPRPSACRATCRHRRWKAAAMASSCRKPVRTCWGTMRIVAPRCGECGGVFSEFGDLRQCCHGDQSACWRRQAHGSSGGSRQPPAAVAACPYCSHHAAVCLE